MNHRWLVALLLVTLGLGACAPDESGAGPANSSPSPADYYDGY